MSVLCLTVGLILTSWSSGYGLSRKLECLPSYHPCPSTAYNWGSSVVDWRGRSQAVADIFKEGIKEEDISEYLKYVDTCIIYLVFNELESHCVSSLG